jgi:integrase
MVKDIRTAQWQKILDRVCQSGKSASTVKKVRLLMNRLGEYAVENDITDKNYAAFTKLPKFESTEKDIFNDIELLKIERGAENGIGISDIILFMCYTGWRIQEVCNLKVFDYNATEHTLIGGVKTDAGKNRTVFIPDKVLGIVKRYATLNGPALFCYETGRKKKKLVGYSTKKLREEFYNTLDFLGIQESEAEPKRLTPHSTRHTYNSMLNRAGVDTATRMKLMGQVSEQTNQRVYTHTDLEQMRKAVSALG